VAGPDSATAPILAIPRLKPVTEEKAPFPAVGLDCSWPWVTLSV